MKISRREAILIVVCILVLVTVGLPTMKKYNVTSGGKSAAELAADRQTLRAEAARLTTENAKLQREVDALTWKIPVDKLPPKLLEEVHAASRQSGVSLGAFRPGKPQAVAAGSKMPVTVRLQAPFSQVRAFLAAIQSEQQRVSLERLQIASTDAASDMVSLEMNLGAYSALPLAKTKAE